MMVFGSLTSQLDSQTALPVGWIACITIIMTSCAPAESGTAPSFLGTVKTTVIDVCKDAFDALQTPLEDLNVKRQPIPEKLQGCAQNPYAMPMPPVCFNTNKELAELDALLGPDMEAKPLPWGVPVPSKIEYVKQGIRKGIQQVPSLARQQAVGMVRSKVNIIPFRGMVRKVSGAEKHADAVGTAYEAGKLRRAFLKGLSLAYGCSMPLASPFAAEPTQDADK